MSDRTYQDISRLCHDAETRAVLTSVQRYYDYETLANWQRSEGEPFEHWLDVVEAIAQILEGWDGSDGER